MLEINWKNKKEVLKYIEDMNIDFSERKALNFIEKNIYFNNEEVMLKAIEICGIFFKYVSDKLKNDINFIKKAEKILKKQNREY